MIRSMTAFSRKELSTENGTLSWEIRSVNQRFLEVIPRLPDHFRDLEMPVRDRLRQRLSRGKVECTLKFKGDTGKTADLKLNETLVQQILASAKTLAEITGSSSSISPQTLLTWPGVVETPEADFKGLQALAMQLFDRALDDFIQVREREGAELRRLLEERLDAICGHVAVVREAIPGILQAQRERLQLRLQEFLANLDAERVEQEMVMLAHKSDVEEELDRLSTHADEVRRILAEGGAQGRRLDFLMQELNREANTLGSKSVHVSTTQIAVELKVLIEQMREQVQNIE
ncbi:Conserved hypothetical protein 255 [gamma proteobacterium HdN1]|nr:Conserved hypothetical protein 255 [gamma proteobacterium HdN1]